MSGEHFSGEHTSAQLARPSMSFVDHTIALPWQTLWSPEFGTKFQRERRTCVFLDSTLLKTRSSMLGGGKSQCQKLQLDPSSHIDTTPRRRLRSASTEQLDVLTCRRSTIGGRAFPVAGANVWNGLPSDVTSASSLSVFKNRLKTYLFRRCYETVWLWIAFLFPSHYLPSRTVVLAIVFTVWPL